MRLVSVRGRRVVHVAHDAQEVHHGRIRTLCPAIRKNIPGKLYDVHDALPTNKRLCHDCERLAAL